MDKPTSDNKPLKIASHIEKVASIVYELSQAYNKEDALPKIEEQLKFLIMLYTDKK